MNCARKSKNANGAIDDDIVDPGQIFLKVPDAKLKQNVVRSGLGHAIVFPEGPPPPLELCDEDVPICDTSSQIKISPGDIPSHQLQAIQNEGSLQKGRALQIMAVQHLKRNQNAKHSESQEVPLQSHQGRNHQLTGSGVSMGSVENQQLIQQAPAVQLSTLGSIKHKKPSHFSEVFPKLNEQAIDLLVRQSEPETALDVLRQALSELNAEKQITEDMPHYRHKLMTKDVKLASDLMNNLTSKSKVIPHQQSQSTTAKKTIEQAQPNQKLSASKKQNGKQSLQLSQAESKAQGLEHVKHGAPMSPKLSKNHKDVLSTFFDKQQKLTQQQSSYNSLPKVAGIRGGQSTKCASSNSTWEPSSNNIASSIKSSVVTTPTSPSIVALTQSELKDRTRESNLIVCLYYNLACCYQRLGLLEEAVEYLELASDQLEDTVQFFEFQEETIIKQRHLRSQQQQQQHQAVTVSQYATEQPHRTSKIDNDHDAEYGKQGGLQGKQQQSRLLPAQVCADYEGQRHFKQRNLSSSNFKPGLASQQTGKKRKELKREKISIKDCSAPVVRETEQHHSQQQSSPTCENITSSKVGNQLQRMSQDASKLLSSKALSKIEETHFIDMHNSAEQLTKTTTATMLPKSSNQLQFASFTNNNYSSLIEKNSSSGRNVSPVTSASIPPESTVFSLNANNNSLTGCITIEQLLAEKMHKSRYQCKMNLQICALQSQLAKHQDALIYGRRAAQICFKLIKNAQMLCKRYVQQIQRHIQARQAKATRDQYGNTLPTVPDQNSTGESPNSRYTRPQKAQTEINDSFSDDYQAAKFYRKPKTRMETGSVSSTYSASTNAKGAKKNNNREAAGGVGSFKRPRSSCSASSHSSTASKHGLTRLRLSRESLAVLNPNAAIARDKHGRTNHSKIDGGSRSSRDSSRPKTNTSCRDSSTESLDRIHTFSLKTSANQLQNARHSQSVTETSISAADKLKKPKSVYEKVGPETSTFGQPLESLTGLKVNRIEGKQHVLMTTKTTQNNDEMQKQGLLSISLQKYVQEADLFDGSAIQARERIESSTFQNQQNITQAPVAPKNVYIEESVKVLESLIIQADPVLQELASIVKEFEDKSQKSAIDRDQEMIKKYGETDFRDRRRRLKISFSTMQDLIHIEKDLRFKLNVRNTLGVKNSQDWIFNLNIGNVMHLNMMKEQELNAKIENTHELTKDTMLEKVVLITSAYFCIATEIRFILQKDLLDVKLISKKDSEAFHAKALHIALLFLPEDCPLSQYIHQTYCKNYLNPKLKLQKQRNAYISQKLSKQHQSRQKQLAQNQAEKDTKKHHDTTKRPQTVLSTNQQIHKMLISTKSYEGLTPSQATTTAAIDFGMIQCSLPPKTATAAHAKSAHQNAVSRKSGVTPDLPAKKPSQVFHGVKKPSVVHNNPGNLIGARQSQQCTTSLMTLKNTRPSVTTTHSKKLKRQSGTSQILHRPITSTGQATSLMHKQQHHALGQGASSVSKLRLRSPSTTGSAYQYATAQNSRSAAATQGSSKAAEKQRDSSSVRKIKIDLGQICGQSPENKATAQQHTLLARQHHIRSSSLRRFGKKPMVPSIASSGYGQNQTSASGYLTSANNKNGKSGLGAKKNSASVSGLPKHNPSQTMIKHSSQQIKQSMGDCSGTTAAGLSSTLAKTHQTGTAGPSNILSSPPGLIHSHSVHFVQQAGQGADTTHAGAVAPSQSKQKAIMLAALKLLKIKQLGGGQGQQPSSTTNKKSKQPSSHLHHH